MRKSLITLFAIPALILTSCETKFKEVTEEEALAVINSCEVFQFENYYCMIKCKSTITTVDIDGKKNAETKRFEQDLAWNIDEERYEYVGGESEYFDLYGEDIAMDAGLSAHRLEELIETMHFHYDHYYVSGKKVRIEANQSESWYDSEKQATMTRKEFDSFTFLDDHLHESIIKISVIYDYTSGGKDETTGVLEMKFNYVLSK